MIKNAIGLIETIGLAAGVEAADAAVKSANVKLIGYELSKGDGMCTVKVEGDVGAVKAAVSAATAAASKVSGVYSTHVIPRPAQGLENLIFTKDTVGLEKEETHAKAVDEKPAASEALAETQSAVKAGEPEAEAPETATEADKAPSGTEEEEESESPEPAKAEAPAAEEEAPKKQEAKPKAKSSPSKKGKSKKK